MTPAKQLRKGSTGTPPGGSPRPTKKVKGSGKERSAKEAEETAGEEEDDGDPDKRTDLTEAGISTTPFKKKPTWAGIKDAINLVATGYKEPNIMGEGDTLHEAVRKAIQAYVKYFKRDAAVVAKKTMKASEWQTVFGAAMGKTHNNVTDLYDKQTKDELQTLAARLSRTSPDAFGLMIVDGKITPNNMTTAWDAARQMLGSDWVKRKKKTESTVGFAMDTKPPAKPTARLKQTTLSVYRKYHERYDMVFKAPPNATKATEAMVEKIREWFGEMQLVDPKARILPWKKDSKAYAIDKPSQIPDNVKELRNYFDQIKPQPGRAVWTKVHITTQEQPSQIISGEENDMDLWYCNQGDRLNIRPLRDSDNTAEIGVLTYTGNFLDTKRFMKMINEAVQAVGFTGVLGGKIKKCQDIPLTPEEREEFTATRNSWKKQYWMPIHVSVDQAHKDKAKKALYKVCNDQHKTLPDGTISRYVPARHMATLSNRGATGRANALNKHVMAVKDLQLIEVEYIHALDEKDPTTGTTLREFIGTLRHTITKRRLFQNVDRGTGRNDTPTTATFAVFKEHYEEAEMISSVLPAMCQQRVGATTKSWFGGPFIQRCEGVKFAERGNFFTTEEDDIMQIADADNFGWIADEEETGENLDVTFAAELLDEDKRDRTLNSRPDDATLMTMGIRSRTSNDSDNESTATHTASTLTRSLEKQEELKQEVERLKAMLQQNRVSQTGGDSEEEDEMDLEDIGPGAGSNGTGGHSA